MKPTVKLAETHTPEGGEMVLYQHDQDFSIRINGLELMNSRQHESEQELARLGCWNLADSPKPNVLIGGLGMGYTLRQALENLGPDATLVVSELMPDVVIWNREFFGGINAQALDDKRTELVTGDIFGLIEQSVDRFDAILLDIDNGPTAMVDSGNQRLYSSAGIQMCRKALRKQGLLAVWSTEPSRAFERNLMGCGFKARRYKVRNYQQSKAKPLFIWVAAQEEALLPPGGVSAVPTARKVPIDKHKNGLPIKPSYWSKKQAEETTSKKPVSPGKPKSKPKPKPSSKV